MIILAIIVVYVSVWVVADNEISPTLAPVAAGSRQQLGPGVTYVPSQGWYVDRTDSNASDSSATLVLAGSAGTMQFRVTPWTGPGLGVDRRERRPGDRRGRSATDTAFNQVLPDFQAMLDSIRTEQS